VTSHSSANPKPRWIDFHCHLDLYPNHVQLIEECDRLGIATLAVTTTPKAWPRNQELARHARHVRVALGLHPQLVNQRAAEISEFEEYLPQTRYVGEVGLDAGPRYFKSLPQQKLVFQKVLQLCAAHGEKILTIHSVRTVTQVLDMIESYLPANKGRVVLHWFTGTKTEARRAVELGCYFSINREMLVKPARRALVRELPADRLLTETDGPFVKIEDRQVVPMDIQNTVSALAAVCGVPEKEMATRLLRNLLALVS
jgi:TatD DNase family protein